MEAINDEVVKVELEDELLEEDFNDQVDDSIEDVVKNDFVA